MTKPLERLSALDARLTPTNVCLGGYHTSLLCWQVFEGKGIWAPPRASPLPFSFKHYRHSDLRLRPHESLQTFMKLHIFTRIRVNRALKSGEHFQKDEVWRMHLVACQDALDQDVFTRGRMEKERLK